MAGHKRQRSCDLSESGAFGMGGGGEGFGSIMGDGRICDLGFGPGKVGLGKVGRF